MMEFTKPQSLTAVYKITTPMFLGGENQQADALQFRNASFKGALRFWWRALNWGRVLKAAANDPEQALKALHAEEGALFGQASDRGNSHQSLVWLNSRLRNAQVVRHSANDDSLKNVAYLLGLGLWSNNDKGPAGHRGIQRDYLQAGATVELELSFLPAASAEQITQTRQAAMALGFFGGLGSRDRRGLGSLALQSTINIDGQKKQITELDDIRQFVKGLAFSAPPEAPLTAFTQGTRIDASAKGNDVFRVLRTVSNQLQAYRDGTVGGSRLNNFPDDRNLARKAQEGQRIDTLPRRATFGMPHNYQWGTPKLDITPASSERNRRASPLFIHIHEFPDGSVVAIQTLMGTTFLPTGTEIELKSYPSKKTQTMPLSTMDYQVIHDYLDHHYPSKEDLRHG